MEILLEGKTPAEQIKSTFEDRLNYLKKNDFCPKLAVLALNMEDASASYVRRIENNCQKYGIGFELFNTNLAGNNNGKYNNFILNKQRRYVKYILFNIL